MASSTWNTSDPQTSRRNRHHFISLAAASPGGHGKKNPPPGIRTHTANRPGCGGASLRVLAHLVERGAGLEPLDLLGVHRVLQLDGLLAAVGVFQHTLHRLWTADRGQ